MTATTSRGIEIDDKQVVGFHWKKRSFYWRNKITGLVLKLSKYATDYWMI